MLAENKNSPAYGTDGEYRTHISSLKIQNPASLVRHSSSDGGNIQLFSKKKARSHLTIRILSFTHPHIEKSGNFRSKTLALKNKNKIFPKFLSPSIITTYEHQVHSGKSRRFISISFDFSIIIWYNTHMLASRLTQTASRRSYRPESQVKRVPECRNRGLANHQS